MTLHEQFEGRVGGDLGGIEFKIHPAVGDILKQLRGGRLGRILFANAHCGVGSVGGKIKSQPVGGKGGINLIEGTVDPLGQGQGPSIFRTVPPGNPDIEPAPTTGSVTAEKEEFSVSTERRGSLLEFAVQGPHRTRFAPAGAIPETQEEVRVALWPHTGVDHPGPVRGNRRLADILALVDAIDDKFGRLPQHKAEFHILGDLFEGHLVGELIPPLRPEVIPGPNGPGNQQEQRTPAVKPKAFPAPQIARFCQLLRGCGGRFPCGVVGHSWSVFSVRSARRCWHAGPRHGRRWTGHSPRRGA